ncbi:MAG: Amino acid/polyamine/organocation transporter, superfamily [Lacunisphaera sp.]|nr:Amino acid/polyamine/organocation transporter, superfamily [Lacunisphaera sp.]
MAAPTAPQLVRVLGRATLVALVINCVIGSGIFGLPGDIARDLGGAAPWAYLIAAIGVGALMGIYAELGAQSSEAGGSYLWAREAFGRHAGIQMAWFVWLTRLTSAAANANLFITYLGEFWPGATAGAPRAVLLVAMLGGLTLINYRGVQTGARVSNIFTVAKLFPMALLIGAGLLFAHKLTPAPLPHAPGATSWLNALVVLMFAYGGFETAVIPLAEARQPGRDVPFALVTGLVVIAGFYTLLHCVAMWTVPDLAHSARPLADAARTLFGDRAAQFVSLGAMISTFGYLCAQLVAVPRLTYALAVGGDFPAVFGRVHERYRTPAVSILLWGVLVLALAFYGSFLWNAVLSVAARIISYVMVCGAFVKLRRSRPPAGTFRLPAGYCFVAVGLVFCALLLTRLTADHAGIIGAVGLIAVVNWLVVRRQGGPSGSSSSS